MYKRRVRRASVSRLGFRRKPRVEKNVLNNLPKNKINLLRNDFETDYRILTGEIAVERLNVDDLVEIIQYGWDGNDLQRMLDTKNYQAIGCLAA